MMAAVLILSGLACIVAAAFGHYPLLVSGFALMFAGQYARLGVR